MRQFRILLWTWLLHLTQALSTERAVQEDPAKSQLDTYQAEYTKNMKALLAGRTSGCTQDTLVVRKEWHALTKSDRLGYIEAVKCLKKKDPITPSSFSNGTKSRYDDFEASHIKYASFVHEDFLFLSWHRYFVHAYENALRNECGYTGHSPYWDWSLNDANFTQQAIFSGEDDSFGGNGIFVKRDILNITLPTQPPTNIQVEPGTGGGCITNGPFVNFTQNLGPLGPPVLDTGFNYNPRCIERDWKPTIAANILKYSNVSTALESLDLAAFGPNFTNIHNFAHASVGGTIGDTWSSVGDPLFYLLHGNVDRIWAIWQGLDFKNREFAVASNLTLTFRNSPPSAPGTQDSVMDWGYVGGPKKVRELASTIDNGLCYIYG